MGHDSRKGQLELGIQRIPEKDRNFHMGGRSFYFFDFDDNIMFLLTPLVLFHRETGHELKIGSGEFAREQAAIGKQGLYKDYEIRFDPRTGTFRYFRDHEQAELQRLGKRRQVFIEDILYAIDLPDPQWKGPSWECFYHASFNQRPLSLITARGHHPETFRQGIQEFVLRKILPMEPNYLSIFPVSHPEVRKQLGDEQFVSSVAELKQRAISASVEKAFELYGYNPHHRFGMSDDDPKNIQSIVEEMVRLKNRFPENSFFMIETHYGSFVKHEITLSGVRSDTVEEKSQLSLFHP